MEVPPTTSANTLKPSLMDDAPAHLGDAFVNLGSHVYFPSPLCLMAGAGCSDCHSTTGKNSHKMLQEAVFGCSRGLSWPGLPCLSPPVQSPQPEPPPSIQTQVAELQLSCSWQLTIKAPWGANPSNMCPLSSTHAQRPSTFDIPHNKIGLLNTRSLCINPS